MGQPAREATLGSLEMQVLPIKLAPYVDEGGHGFLLRALVKNGVSLSHVANWMKLSHSKQIKGRDALRWGWTVGIDPDWLALRLPQVHRIDGGATFELYGHAWRGAHSFRLAHPQVCVKCINERGYIRACWDVMAVCVCTRHQVLLSDVCSRCKRLLVWSRPGLGICCCGQYLRSEASDGQEKPSSRLLAWTEWISAHLQEGGPASLSPMLPGLPQALSVDGAYRLLLAFGLKEHPHACLSPKLLQRRIAPRQMGAILERGYGRLSEVLLSAAWSDVAPLLHEPTLDRLESVGVSQADRDLAHRVKIEAFGRTLCRDPARRPNGKGQFELFPESFI